MTVSTTITKNLYTANGSTATFAYQFKIFVDADLQVLIRTDSTGAESAAKTLGVDYSMTGAGVATGGTVTFLAGKIPTTGQTIVLRRNVLQTQTIDYIANDPFPAETHEEGLDRGIMVAQQNKEEADRSIKLSRTNTMNSTEFKVGATERAGKVLAFDTSGELAVTQELGSFKGNSATVTTAAFSIRDIVKSTTTAQLNNIYICIKASPIGTSLTNTSFWVLIVDAFDAAASAATATAKAAEAVAAKDAAVVAKDASVVAKDASVVAQNASVAAKDLSVTAKNAAESAFDNFDDRYLGAKSSEPSADNDGNALITGALYFNSTSSQFFVRTSGSAWISIKPTSSEQTNINTLSASAVVTDMSILGTADVVADMNTLGSTDVVSDMNTLATADIVSDMNILATADVVNDMNVLGSSATVTAMNLLGTSAVVTDMGILGTAAIVEDMGILATPANVTAMGLLGTSAVVTDMGLLGTSDNVTNMDTCADNLSGINSFAARYRIVASNPTDSLDAGDLAFVTNDSNLKFYNGTAWVAISPGIANVVDDSTPQLGGNLDVQTNQIVTTSNRDLELAPNGTGAVEVRGNTNSGKIILNCEANTHGFYLQAQPHSAGYTGGWTFPTTSGTSGQVLATNGNASAQLSWVSAQETKPTVADVSQTIAPASATTINITGTNFVSIPQVQFINGSTGAITNANTVSFTNATTLSVNVTLASGNYFVRIENPDGNAGRSTNNILTASTSPSFTTAAGSLGSVAGNFSGTVFTVQGSSDSAITFSEVTSVLVGSGGSQANCSLATNGVISTSDFGGSSTAATTYNFTLRITDAEGQTVDRDFSLTSSFGATGGGQFN